MTDRTTKVLLALIALGLWANVTVQAVQPALAQDTSRLLRQIQADLNGIAYGICVNGKIC